jgi:hypothetical protein
LRGTCTATLDLHGHDVRSARARLVMFLGQSDCARPDSLVLVIVGKGKHSPGGSRHLAGRGGDVAESPPAALHVLAFRTAPAALGGSGGVYGAGWHHRMIGFGRARATRRSEPHFLRMHRCDGWKDCLPARWP